MRKIYKNCRLLTGIHDIVTENGIITFTGTGASGEGQVIDLHGKWVIPGMIDPHVHVRDLRQAEKEDWTSMSLAALRGGVTTVFDMPNNKPPTTNLANLNQKRAVAKASKVNYKFNIAATAYNLPEVVEILETHPDDVAALKLFLAGSNSNEFVNDTEVIKRIFDISLKYDLPVIVHTEWQACVEKFTAKVHHPTVKDHNYIRNRACSIQGTELVIDIATAIGNKLYIAHTSTAEEIDIIRAAKRKCRVYCETTPHHLLLNEEILEEMGNFGKVNPPLRTRKDNERIMRGIIEGTVDTIGTDHAPHRKSEKLLPYEKAPSGFPGLETGLPLLLQEVKKGSFSMERLIDITSRNSAAIFGLEKRGAIEVGYYADLVAVDFEKTWKIEAERFLSKAKYSPFAQEATVLEVLSNHIKY